MDFKLISLAPNQTYGCFYGIWIMIRKCRNLNTFKRRLELFVPSAPVIKKSKNRCKSYKVATLSRTSGLICEQSPTLDENNEKFCCIDLLLFWYDSFLWVCIWNSRFVQFNSYNGNNFYSVSINWHPVASSPGYPILAHYCIPFCFKPATHQDWYQPNNNTFSSKFWFHAEILGEPELVHLDNTTQGF